MHCFREFKMVHLFWKPFGYFLKILKTELLYDPAAQVLYIYLREIKCICVQKIDTSVYSNIIMAQNRKKSPSTDQWINELWNIHIKSFDSPHHKAMLIHQLGVYHSTQF